MARAIGMLLLLAVVAAGGWVLWRMTASLGPENGESSIARVDGDSPSRSPAPERRRPQSGEIVPRASRDVTPPGVTLGPPVTGPLVRIPGPEKPAPEPAPPEPRLERLFRPVVDTAGAIETAAGRLSIADIEAPELESSCGDGAQNWPCGRVARAELRRFIRGRAIECQVPAGAESLPETVRCSVGGDDIGEWLVRHGWARPAGGTYANAAKEAQTERRGLWGDGPR